MNWRYILCVLNIIVLSACGKSNISADCNLTEIGEAKCTFKNEGSAEGSKCVYIGLQANEKSIGFMDTATIAEIKKTNNKLDGVTSLLVEKSLLLPKNEICSGMVKPNDVRQMDQNLDYRIGKPSDWCASKSSEITLWPANCTQVILESDKLKNEPYNENERNAIFAKVSQRIELDTAYKNYSKRETEKILNSIKGTGAAANKAFNDAYGLH